MTLIERYILESIDARSLTLKEIQEKTSLDLQTLKTNLHYLEQIGLVTSKESVYKVSNIPNQTQDKTTVEISDLVTAMIRTNITNNEKLLGLKKVFLDHKDEKLLSAMIKNIDLFLEQADIKGKCIKNKKVFFWGLGNYQQVIANELSF